MKISTSQLLLTIPYQCLVTPVGYSMMPRAVSPGSSYQLCDLGHLAKPLFSQFPHL